MRHAHLKMAILLHKEATVRFILILAVRTSAVVPRTNQTNLILCSKMAFSGVRSTRKEYCHTTPGPEAI